VNCEGSLVPTYQETISLNMHWFSIPTRAEDGKVDAIYGSMCCLPTIAEWAFTQKHQTRVGLLNQCWTHITHAHVKGMFKYTRANNS
jgi:hypothetical protein